MIQKHRTVGSNKGEIDMRFAGWRPFLDIFMGHHGILVVKLVCPEGAKDVSTVYLWAVVSRFLNFRLGERIACMRYDCNNGGDDDGRFRIFDEGGSLDFDTCWFRVAGKFSLDEYINTPGGPIPEPVIYDSKWGEGGHEGMPHPNQLNQFFDKP